MLCPNVKSGDCKLTEPEVRKRLLAANECYSTLADTLEKQLQIHKM
jgi:hypothetical protein